MSGEALKAKERGNAAYKKRDFAAAHGHYDGAILLSPREITFYSNKGAAFMEEGKYEDCIAVCLKAVDFGLENKIQLAKAMARTGTAYAKLGNTTEAVKWYEKSLSEHHNPDVAKKAAEMTEILQKTVKTEDTPSPVPRKPLSPAYITAMFYPLLRCPDTIRLSDRCKNVIYSSPTITDKFLAFMKYYTVVLHPENFSIEHMLFQKDITRSIEKKWEYFTWMIPFIRALVLELPQPYYAHSILTKTGRFLNAFHYLHTVPPSEDVISFVRRQMPHLTALCAFYSLFELIPCDKHFDDVIIVCTYLEEFSSIFLKKPFTANGFCILCPDLSFDRSFALDDVVSFFENTNVRMPGTDLFSMDVQIFDYCLPISRVIKVLRSVFSGLEKIIINVVFFNKLQSLYDFGKLDAAYNHCRREIVMLPDDLRIVFNVNEHVFYGEVNLAKAEFEREHKSPHFQHYNSGDTSGFSTYVSRSNDVGNDSTLFYKLDFSISE